MPRTGWWRRCAMRGGMSDTVRRYQVVPDRFAAFLTGRGVDAASELVCIDFIANQTSVRLEIPSVFNPSGACR